MVDVKNPDLSHASLRMQSDREMRSSRMHFEVDEALEDGWAQEYPGRALQTPQPSLLLQLEPRRTLLGSVDDPLEGRRSRRAAGRILQSPGFVLKVP